MSQGYGQFKEKIRRKHSGEYKQEIVEDIQNNKLSYMDASRKYEVSDTIIVKWERIYLEEGVAGLYKERRGQASKMDSPNKGRPKTLDKKVEEDLIAENQRLRMENEYLKKLNALIHQKGESAKKTKHK